jgi:hypothetical protein
MAVGGDQNLGFGKRRLLHVEMTPVPGVDVSDGSHLYSNTARPTMGQTRTRGESIGDGCCGRHRYSVTVSGAHARLLSPGRWTGHRTIPAPRPAGLSGEIQRRLAVRAGSS